MMDWWVGLAILLPTVYNAAFTRNDRDTERWQSGRMYLTRNQAYG
jgi:hypothetical protein